MNTPGQPSVCLLFITKVLLNYLWLITSNTATTLFLPLEATWCRFVRPDRSSILDKLSLLVWGVPANLSYEWTIGIMNSWHVQVQHKSQYWTNMNFKCLRISVRVGSSSETQGQIIGWTGNYPPAPIYLIRPTICPWVSEDGVGLGLRNSETLFHARSSRDNCPWMSTLRAVFNNNKLIVSFISSAKWIICLTHIDWFFVSSELESLLCRWQEHLWWVVTVFCVAGLLLLFVAATNSGTLYLLVDISVQVIRTATINSPM